MADTKVSTEPPHPRSCLPQSRSTSNAWLEPGYKGPWLLQLIQDNFDGPFLPQSSHGVGQGHPQPASQSSFFFCPILLPPLPFQGLLGGGDSLINVLPTKLSQSLLLESPTCKRSRRCGSTHAQTSASGHWGNRPEQEPGKALISYHCRGNLEQLSTQHRIWHTKVLFLEENNFASLLQFLPDNGAGLGEISLGPYGPETGVTAMVPGNKLCSLRFSNICPEGRFFRFVFHSL